METQTIASKQDVGGRARAIEAARHLGRWIPWDKVGLPAVIVALALFFGTMNPNFFSQTNITNVARQSVSLALLASGQTFAILSGGIDLSVGSLMGLVSVVTAQQMLVFGMWPGIGAGLLAGTLAGLANGLLIAKVKLPPFVATLGMFSFARGLALTLTGGVTVPGLPQEFLAIGSGNVGPIPTPFLIVIIVFVISHLLLTRTRLGRYIYAIGGNEEAARLSGINVTLYKALAYVICGFLAAVGAVILTSRTISGQPTMGDLAELYAIAAVVIGGTPLGGGVGSIVNTFMGMVVMAILNNGLNLLRVSSYMQMMAVGLVIALAVFIDMRRQSMK